MKNIFFLFFVLLFANSFSQSKTFKITGKVISANDSIPIESATVYVERPQDSTLITYTITNKEGDFEIIDQTYDDKVNFTVSYVGHQPYFKQISIDKEAIQLGSIGLEIANNLDEILIKSRAPITIKKDTLEFNVKSFKTKKDANVEDLLKQLPGVEVNDAGEITVNGKPVNKILVNGKPFFGDDPTITTRNLTKEIIDKVQITDTKTKSEAFSGEEGDKDNKTINLTIKEENNKGVFGRVSAGAGTDERYEYAGLVNIFDNEQRFSILAGGNNTNSPGFSFGEIQKMFGAGNSMSINSNGNFTIDGRSFGGGEGITVSNNIGANYADVLAEGVDISGDYFYSGSESENQTRIEREVILPDSRYFTNSMSNSNNSTDNHSTNLQFDIEVDSTFLINVSPSFRFSRTRTDFSRMEETLDQNRVLTNNTNLNSNVERLGKNFGNQLGITKRFGDAGAFLRVNLDTEFNDLEADDFIASETNFSDGTESIIRDQFSDDQEELKSYIADITYRIPLVSKTFFLDLKYSQRKDERENVRSTFDFEDATQDYTDFNQQLSTDFRYLNSRYTPGMELVYRKEKWSVSGELGYVFRTIENSDALRPELDLEQRFEAIELQSRFNYRFSPNTSMYMGYTLSNQPPSLQQIRPFQDVSDPLNIITGNPNLNPVNRHDLYIGFNSFDFQKKTGFFGYANISVQDDNIVSRTTVDPQTLIRETTFTNVDGAYSANLSGSFSKTIQIDSLNSIRYRFGAYGNLNKSINFNNDVRYSSMRTGINPNLRLTYTWDKYLEIEPNYRFSFTKNRFDLDNFQDQEFISHFLGIKTATFIPKGLEWRNDITFNYNPNVAAGFQKSSWFWNSTLAYSVLKDKGTITLKVFDLLNQNTNARRTATENFIQDSQSTVLQQYFMLSFSWKFNSLGPKGETGPNTFFFF